MRRTARLLTGTALALASASGAAALAYAADTGSLRVYPSSVVPGGRVTVDTADCPAGTATGDASAVGAGSFALTPGAHDDKATGQFRVPPSAQPGTYEIVATCAEGDRQTSGDLRVALTSGHRQVQPRGSVKTGVGGALGADPVRTAAGLAALAVAAAGGTWLLHRRARGDGI